LSSVLDTAVDGIMVIDDRGHILVYNKACERLFGYTASEVRGLNIKEMMPSDYSGEHDRYISNYVDTGVRKIIGIGREVRGRHKDGTVFPVELSVGEAQTPEGRQFIGIMRDLRPRKEAERRLNQLQADLLHMARVSAMDEMGAALAHELNQPLTAVMLYLQAVSRAQSQPQKPGMAEVTKTVLEKAVREAERAGNIIQRMRHFVEKREPERRVVDINPLIEDAVELTMLGHRRSTRVLRRLAPDLPRVAVDPVQIQQIIVNLVRNALEAVKTRDAPQVRVATVLRDGQVMVDVEDNGPGVPPDAMHNLFKAFATSKRTGLGLGLAISRTIAQNHGGDLLVDPGGDGRGARFTLALPLAVEEAT
jgi:two-component system sensor kinase FixL